jgi:hypothetical protein
MVTNQLAPSTSIEVDAIPAENELAYLIEGLGNALIEVAEQLRCSPFVAVEQSLPDINLAYANAMIAGRFIKVERIEDALTLIQQIKETTYLPEPLYVWDASLTGKSEAEITAMIKNPAPGQIHVVNGNQQFTRVMSAWGGDPAGSRCPNCGHDIGDFSECSNCLHSL